MHLLQQLSHFIGIPENSTHRYAFPDDGWPVGVVSSKPSEFFQAIQKHIDDEDPATRCERFGYKYNTAQPKQRRIFFGAMITNEPWELLEIVGAEVYGVFHAMVLVESNRTQTLHPRGFKRLQHAHVIRDMFGCHNLQMRPFFNENPRIREMTREQMQRDEILRGWIEMGMGPDDIGYLADLDESFTREFLRAAQTCDADILDYEANHCHRKIHSTARVFEGSPDCVAGRSWNQYVCSRC